MPFPSNSACSETMWVACSLWPRKSSAQYQQPTKVTPLLLAAAASLDADFEPDKSFFPLPLRFVSGGAVAADDDVGDVDDVASSRGPLPMSLLADGRRDRPPPAGIASPEAASPEAPPATREAALAAPPPPPPSPLLLLPPTSPPPPLSTNIEVPCALALVLVAPSAVASRPNMRCRLRR
jgi:hypothetical protein